MDDEMVHAWVDVKVHEMEMKMVARWDFSEVASMDET